MEELRQRIISDAQIRPGGIIKVDNFLNHQMDTELIDHIGLEFYNYFKNKANVFCTSCISLLAYALQGSFVKQ